MISAVRPYYDWPLPLDYTFIVQAYPFRPTLNSTSQCSYLNAPTSVNFKATINNVTYPTRIPFYLDKRLNFTCLNSPSYTNPKTILLWNKFLGAPLFDYGSGHRQPFIDHKCPVTNCLITSDRSKITNADLVLFHMRSRINEFPPVRFSWQRWVYVVFESPQHCPMCHRFKNVFNMSATYKMDSDFTSLYLTDSGVEWTSPSQKKAELFDKRDFSLGKTGLAYAMISSCQAPSRRLEYIEELKRFVSVDVYGKCGEKKCAEGASGCEKEILARKYKFYLAFENSLCSEYVTEKFMEVVYGQEIVAVVMSGGGYENFATGSAYMADYETPGHLARYLEYLEPGRIFGRVHLENVLVLHGQSLGESGNSLEWVEGSSL